MITASQLHLGICKFKDHVGCCSGIWEWGPVKVHGLVDSKRPLRCFQDVAIIMVGNLCKKTSLSADALATPEERRKVDIYKGMYDDGPRALREWRLKKLAEIGIIDKSGAGEWTEFTPEQKKQSSGAMEACAGMVDSLDVNIGKVVDYLKSTGEYDITFIVFMSDNGAEGAALEAIPVIDDKITRAIHQYSDNSYDNISAYNSYTWNVLLEATDK
ncbi:uncharacterized protein N0V89_002335 [Didymosphaeria variabile]|uniref:Sulfatase N-terminal domain-containing protein n=1 Tax=Didymosphaeria variabile TaxID=1932322 RepID=A0A9W9CEF5_9PLEO|nr:uncharacterized protein N0V89_002335 [Didymosphaeria variabile]KAJ4357759.1 hypothetical protein N0V89_002335 [Didymosphaeria variabile]